MKLSDKITLIYPNTQWVLDGDKYENLFFLDLTNKLTEEDFNAQWLIKEQELKVEAEAKETARQALLDKLGITADEAKLLLG
jgi:hypothetical protein